MKNKFPQGGRRTGFYFYISRISRVLKKFKKNKKNTCIFLNMVYTIGVSPIRVHKVKMVRWSSG